MSVSVLMCEPKAPTLLTLPVGNTGEGTQGSGSASHLRGQGLGGIGHKNGSGMGLPGEG